MHRAERRKPTPSSATKPITLHHEWQKMSWAASEHPAEAGWRPTEPYREDRSGFGVEHRTELSTEPTVLMGDGSREQQYLSVSLEQQAGDTAPRVFIGHKEVGGLAATLDEARRFALDIVALVDGHEG